MKRFELEVYVSCRDWNGQLFYLDGKDRAMICNLDSYFKKEHPSLSFVVENANFIANMLNAKLIVKS